MKTCREIFVLDKSSRKNQNSNFFKKNLAVCEITSKNKADPEGPRTTSQYGAYELHAG